MLLAVVLGPVALALYGFAHVAHRMFFERCLKIMSWSPWILVAVIYAVAFHLRLTLDHSWPWQGGSLDYAREPQADGPIKAIFLSVIIFYCWVMPVWFGATLIRFGQLRQKPDLASIVALVSGLVSLTLLCWYDPGGFWFWAIDMGPWR